MGPADWGNWRRKALIAGLFAYAMMLLGPSAAAQTDSLSIQRTDTGQPVPTSDIDRAVTRSGLLARLPSGGVVSVHGLAVTGAEPSAVYLAASSDYLMAAVLSGAVEGGGLEAEAGQVLLRPMDGDAVRRFAFDVDRFLGSSTLVIDPALRASLEEAGAGQESKIFWGLLKPIGVNAQAPFRPDMEASRRDYLLHPEIIAIRRDAQGDRGAMARGVAERFLAALQRRDSAAVRALLAPSLFQTEGDTASRWLDVRAQFADQLTGGALPGRLGGAELQPSDDPAVYTVTTGAAETFSLSLSEEQSMYFVTSFEQTEGPISRIGKGHEPTS